MKDNFSSQADQYALYRPTYPTAIFDVIEKLVANKQCAWDCGTGNGQVAIALASIFEQVHATDISQAQLDHATPAPNIVYGLQPAEQSTFADHTFDLIVVAQAIHWFDFERFYAEVRRVAKPQALLCVIGYGRLQINPAVDALISHFYQQVIGKYWDKERRYIDENYETIPFPFAEIQVPPMVNQHQWTLAHLLGYLHTWSAVKHYIKQEGHNPIDHLAVQLSALWSVNETKTVTFPLLCRMGQL